jgi:hypothetical protein
MKRYHSVLFFLGWMLFSTTFLFAQDLKELKEGFQHPPVRAYPKTYWWWLNGNVDTVRIREEMQAMKAAGLSGFDIFEIGVPANDTVVRSGPPFLSDESLEAIRVALSLAKELGMTAGLNMASSWNAGGTWTTPEHAAKSIYFSVTPASPAKMIKLKFPEIKNTDNRGQQNFIQFQPDGRPAYYEEIVVLAIPSLKTGPLDTSDILNVTGYFNPETEILDWNHQGNYDIYRYICSNSGERLKLPSKHSAGPIIDHFDARATEAHFQYVINKLKTILGENFRNSALKSLYLASYEATGFTWTPTLPTEYLRLNGYEIYKFIPALFDPESFTPEVIANFKKDFQRTLSELMINNFYKTARRISNEHGLMINSESGGPGFPLHNVPVEPLRSLGVMDLPRGEFWINHNRLNADGIDILRVVKEVSAASHIYGRGIVEEESFTSFQHWQEGPFEMKPAGDRAFCEGMNKVVIHGFSHNPTGAGYPGIVYSAGTHFNDKRVWWPKVKPFTDYLARISHILQEGRFIADVLYYYGDAIPNYTGHKNSRFSVGPGYDYEVVNTEILLQTTVEDGQIILPGGARFKVLCIEPEQEIHPQVFQKIRDLAGQGALILAEKPQRVARRRNLPDLNYTANDIDQLWDDWSDRDLKVLPKGKIGSGILPLQMFKRLEIPADFSFEDAALFFLDYIHYQKDQTDFYLIRNSTDQWISRNCHFRQTGKVPEIWNPIDGTIAPVPVYRGEGKQTVIPLTLPPYGSLLIVFSPGNAVPVYSRVSDGSLFPPLLDYRMDGLYFRTEGKYILIRDDRQEVFSNYLKRQVLSGAWEVLFPEEGKTPKRVIFPRLVSWTESDDAGIKYFSGTATYIKTFQYDIHSSQLKNQKIFLDLGDLSNVAEVWLNDQPLGIVWAKPYQFEVTRIIRPGDNTLKVEVANTWSNRLKGDALTGGKMTHTNITHTNINGLNKVRVPWAEVPLLKSGLFGTVSLVTTAPVQMD